jgi:hypothetical protein
MGGGSSGLQIGILSALYLHQQTLHNFLQSHGMTLVLVSVYMSSVSPQSWNYFNFDFSIYAFTYRHDGRKCTAKSP